MKTATETNPWVDCEPGQRSLGQIVIPELQRRFAGSNDGSTFYEVRYRMVDASGGSARWSYFTGDIWAIYRWLRSNGVDPGDQL